MRSNLPSDLLEDFRLEAAEQLPRCEPLLIEFERAPKSAERGLPQREESFPSRSKYS